MASIEGNKFILIFTLNKQIDLWQHQSYTTIYDMVWRGCIAMLQDTGV